MRNVIKPKDFLLQLKKKGAMPTTISPSDLLEIVELGMVCPLSMAVVETAFHDTLKKAVSAFNSEAALNGFPPHDFDDLYTKYSEYIEALSSFIEQSD